MSTLGPTSFGSTVGVAPALAQSRGAVVSQVAVVGGAAGNPPSAGNQTLAAADTSGATTPMDEVSQEAALLDGAISMPARPLAEIIWRLRASVNTGRGSIRASRTQSASRGNGTSAPSTGMKKAADRAYTTVQSMSTMRTPVRSVDIYHGTKK